MDTAHGTTIIKDMDDKLSGDKDLLYRLAIFFRKNEPFSFKEIQNAFKYVEEEQLRATLAQLTVAKVLKSSVIGAANETIYWTSHLEVWTLISKEGRSQCRIGELLKNKTNPSLKDKYSKKEQVIQQDIELIAERIASLTTSATSLEEFEPPLKRRKIFRAEDVLDAKRLQMRKELDDIDADIERWRQYVQHISNQLCTLRMVNPLQLVRMMGMDFGKARSYGVDICFED